jgi:hypothetical protein
MGDHRRFWLDVRLSRLIWMCIVVANGPVVASMEFIIILGFLGC